MSQSSPFEGLEPRILWQHFSALTRLPRPSGNEAAARDYIRNWAKEKGFEVHEDAAGNLVVHVPASPGREGAAPIVLQGHIDMVCERNADSPYDAETGNIHVVRDGEWIRADGTTLGADNGIGVAAAMAAAEDPSVVHGPLDLVFTIDEETGLTGAQNLDASLVRGRTMLNLDSEEDGVLFVGCAGGCDTKFRFRAERTAPGKGMAAIAVSVKGLQGGHSGLDINKNRLNAIKALVRLLQAGGRAAEVRVATIAGGSKRNAIPRESGAVVYVPAEAEGAFLAAVEKERDTIAAQYRGLDDGFTVETGPAGSGAPADAFSASDSARLLDLLRAIPSSVLAMSADIPGLVETSTNLGVVTTEGDLVEAVSCSRSSVAQALRDVLDTLNAIGRLAGVETEEVGGYPGWKPDMDSPVLAATREVYRELTGRDPEVTAIHAGLECGLLGERVPGMDMISFGPEIRGAHSPDERVHIPSVERFWKLLSALLDRMSA